MVNNNLDELKALWQSQKSGHIDQSGLDKIIPALVDKLKSFEKKQFRINLAKTIAVAVILANFTFLFQTHKTESLFLYVGLVWVLISTVIFMIVYWKKQFKLSELNLNDTNFNLVNTAINKLNYQKRINTRFLPIYVLCLVVGINIVYLGIFNEFVLIKRIIYHLLMSIIIFSAFPIGLKIRNRRFRKEFQPLIDDLNAISNDLKG